MADVVVAGAGPAGCAAALALAGQGRQVELIGLNTLHRGLAGEWLHPAGATGLRRLGVRLDGFTENRGFVVHPGDGRAPLTLPYAEGTSVSMDHQALVDRLREAAARHADITMRLGDRVTGVSPDGTVDSSAGTASANLVVGADGRASVVRRALCPEEPAAAQLSWTAGFELRNVGLPDEGFGHIFLGGPGTALVYRIGPDTLRLSLDVEPRRLAPPEMLRHLRDQFAPVLPPTLRQAFLDADGVRWAANRFRRRTVYGRGRLALVGDAVGYGHPLAAHGITTAVLDAECLARSSTEAYAAERRTRSWASERLGMALHRALTDTGSRVMRESLFHLWQHDDAERDRMMRLLAVQEDSRVQFGRAVARIGAVALTRTTATLSLARWLFWLCGSDPAVPWPVTRQECA